jgi:putative Mg2+ transporter-C (MgtC) family protein
MHEGVNINVDPARIAYGVMTGIGFLGAGTIIHNKGSVRGLTTAAAMWCVAGIGLAIGFGLYLLSGMATLLVVIVLWIMDHIEDRLPKLRYRTVSLRTPYRPGCVAEAVAQFKKGGLDVLDASFERAPDAPHADIHLRICFVDANQYYGLERQIEGDPRYQLLATQEL